MSASPLEELLSRHRVDAESDTDDAWTHCDARTGALYRFLPRSSSFEQLLRLTGKQMMETGKPPTVVPRWTPPPTLVQAFVSTRLSQSPPREDGVDSSTARATRPRIKHNDMLNEYRKVTGDFETTPSQFASMLHQLGLQTVKSNGVRVWDGVAFSHDDRVGHDKAMELEETTA